MQRGTTAFLKLIMHPVKSRLFLFNRLPSAYFAGVRITEADADACIVSVPYKWFTRNPFRSTYFACLSMAAELSTGVLAMMHTFQRDPSVSMLVVKMQSEYLKRAVGTTWFSCADGAALRQCVELALASGLPQSCLARSVGRNAAGEDVAVFEVTWSFRPRIKKP